MTTTTTQLRDLIEPYLAAERLELDDVEVTGQGKGRIVRVAVEGAEVDIDRLAEVSRGISRMLDDQTDIDGSYQLEVTTPGLERKLRRPEQFVKSIGREVVAKVQGEQSNRTIRGTIASATEDSFIVVTENGDEVVSYDDVMKANTVFLWEKAPKPGH